MKPVYDDESSFEEDKPEAHEILIGRSQSQRATKTNIPNENAATLLNIIQSASLGWARSLQKLRLERTGERLTLAQVFNEYNGINRWSVFHHGEVEHLGSVKGFLVHAGTRALDVSNRQESKASSHESKAPQPIEGAPKYDA